ncbi:hypothetical protein VaNZ11_007619, partial [Volvox africanus]
MKRLMQQLHEELNALRQQQDALLKQFVDMRRQDEEERRWVKERLETLNQKVQEATESASALNASALAAAASANAAAKAVGVTTKRAPGIAANSSGSLLKTSSFEFARNLRFPKEGSTGGFGSINLASGAPAGSSPLAAGSLGARDLSHGGSESEVDGLKFSLKSPRRRFQQPSSSSEEAEGSTPHAGVGPMGRSVARRTYLTEEIRRIGELPVGQGRSAAPEEKGAHGVDRKQVSAFAVAAAQAHAAEDLASTGQIDDIIVSGGIEKAQRRRGEAVLRQPGSSLSAEPSGSLQEAMPSFSMISDNLAAMGLNAAGSEGAGSGATAAGSAQNLSTISYGSSLPHSVSMGHSQGHANHHHHQYHHSHSHEHGHHYGHNFGHSNSFGGGGSNSRAFFPLGRNSHHGLPGAFGSVAMLFPSLRHGASADDLPVGTTIAQPPSPTRSPTRSPRRFAASGSSTPYAGVTGGGAAPSVGGQALGLDVARMSVSAGGAAAGGTAPSLVRDSSRSATVSDPETERVDAASTRHFKGISPRLVEIYRQRAEQSHWSLQRDSVQLMRGSSRRGSTDTMQRPTGPFRPAAAVVGSTTGIGSGMSRMSLLHGGGGGGGGGSSKAHDGLASAGVGGIDEASGWVLLDPNYDHPPMIGDDEEYSRPMSLVDRLKLYSVGLIRPEGRTKWDLFILVLLVWVLFASPIIICFGLAGDAFHGDWVGIVELCVDGAFAFDIYLNFRTAYYDSKGYLVTERWRIARHYLKTWFLLDLVCVIPYDLITAGTMGFLSMLKLLRVVRVGKVIRMIRMYRLLRVIRLPRILEQMEMFIDRGVLQVMAFVLSVCLLAHLSACIFFYMAYLDGLGPQTWVAAYGVQEADLATKYLTSLYWAFTTTATVGYGDITPKTDKEKIIAIFVMCLGVSLVGYVTSSITNIMAIKNAQQTNIAAKKQLVMDVLKTRAVPSEVSRRVYNYFDYVSSKMIKREEAGLLAELPFKLRARLLTSFFADTLARIPGISRLPPHVLIELVSQLKPHYFVEGDIVAIQGDYVDALYIVSEGLLEVRTYMFPADVEPWRIFEAVHKDELRYMPYSAEGRLKPRYFFGQAGVLHGGVWPATVIARNCCELYSLDREGLEHMLAVQPELQNMLGVPHTPVPASVAHAAFVSGPGVNALLPPADRAALLADFPLMDPAPQRGLMRSMLRSMGNIITGGLARASAAHYPNMPGSPTSAGSGGGSGGGGGGGGARSMLRGLMGWRKGGEAVGGARDADGHGVAQAQDLASGSVEPPPAESSFSRFRPFGRRGPRNTSVVQLLPSEASSLLHSRDERSDANGEAQQPVVGMDSAFRV